MLPAHSHYLLATLLALSGGGTPPAKPAPVVPHAKNFFPQIAATPPLFSHEHFLHPLPYQYEFKMSPMTQVSSAEIPAWSLEKFFVKQP